MEWFASALRFRQFTQFLGHTAVVGFFSFPKRQTQFGRNSGQVVQHLLDVDRSAGKQLLESPAFFWRLRMQGKSRPLDVNVKRMFQFFNTPGDEIAPGSDVVGKNFQLYGIFNFIHFF